MIATQRYLHLSADLEEAAKALDIYETVGAQLVKADEAPSPGGLPVPGELTRIFRTRG